jgi:hypothetical protein
MPERSPAPLRPAPRHRSPFRSKPALRAGLALTLTAPALVGVLAAGSPEDNARDTLAAATAGTTDGAAALVEMSDLSERAERASRSAVRTMRPVTMKPRAVDQQWAAAPLNVWTGPGEHTKRVGLVERGTKLAVTGQRVSGFAEVLLGDKKRDRWVNARYLANQKPKPKPKPQPSRGGSSASTSGSTSGSSSGGGLSTAPCPDGSSIEAGLTSNAVAAYRAVCNAFPSLTSYGGREPRGEHFDGRAIDFMTSSSLGNAIAEYLRANAGTLNVRNIIWAQRIWSSERASEGWRPMSDRGSATANHYDHVHVSVH